ncbi:hypothetical protein [Halochromatium salexigens]|nr:hypothetical protein [Halochromatium salexigens]
MVAPDDSWISVSGTVESVTHDAFVLDYGEGVMTVEMDDGDRDADGYRLVRGDNVTVNGRIDDDLFEARTLEASSVYVENIDTYFYASAFDDEAINDVIVTVQTPVVISATTVQGTVTEVGSEEFVVDTGLSKVRVEVDELAYNPLDDEGYQKIEVGNRVSVTGQIDDDLFEGRELVADSVITLSSSS